MERWHTKEDVIKDLALANGLGTNFVDDDFIISGTRPPPPPRHLKEDDEMELRYGRFGSEYHESLKPDLKGISEMLRMVNEPQKKDCKENKPEETRIVISKLNPYVPEFVPKLVMNVTNKSDSLFNGITVDKVANDSETVSRPCKKEETIIIKVAENSAEAINGHPLEPCQDAEFNNRESCDQNDDEKLQDKSRLEASLREKIIKTSKAKTIKEKSAKNVAIMALLRLKSASPQSLLTTSSSESRSDSPASTNTNNSSQKEPLILHPPNFYESKNPTVQANNVTSLLQSTATPDNSNNEKNNQKESEEEIASNIEPAEVTKSVVNPEEKKAIQKVMQWLNYPGKPIPLEPLHAGPINFKKREAAPLTGAIVYKKKETKESSNSPISNATNNKPFHSQPGSFVPSKFANELVKKYEQRAKANEDRQLDMWSKLERDLKAKDEIVKERMKAQCETSPNDSRGSSRCSSRRQNPQ